MFRLLASAILVASLSACAIDDEVPPPAPPTGRIPPTTQPRPGPQDAGDTDSPFPDAGAFDIDAADLSCGEFGDVCCTDGRPCVSDFTHCDADFGVCAACGDTAGPCCSDGPACQPGMTCAAGICSP